VNAEQSGGNVPIEFRGCSAMQGNKGYGFNTVAELRNTFCARPPRTPCVSGQEPHTGFSEFRARNSSAALRGAGAARDAMRATYMRRVAFPAATPENANGATWEGAGDGVEREFSLRTACRTGTAGDPPPPSPPGPAVV